MNVHFLAGKGNNDLSIFCGIPSEKNKENSKINIDKEN
jgi:hypothetical protein